MRLELEQNHPQFAPSTEDLPTVTNESKSAEAADLVRDGIKAAQAGDRAGSRSLLLRSVDIDPENEKAWLWLSSISEYPEELLSFLTRVLEINPKNERALEWSSATKALLAKSLVQRGIDAAEANQPEAASELFDQAIAYDEHNADAWLRLAALATSGDEKLAYYERVLEFDPENDTARAGCTEVRETITQVHMSSAAVAAFEGRFQEADQLLEALLANDPGLEDAWVLRSHLTLDFESKTHLYGKVLEINPANAFAAAGLESIRAFRDASIVQPSGSFDDRQAADREVTVSPDPETKPVAFEEEDTTNFDAAPFPSFDHTIIVKPLDGNSSYTDEDAPFVPNDLDDSGCVSGEFDAGKFEPAAAAVDAEPVAATDAYSDPYLNGECKEAGPEPVEVVTYEMLPEEAADQAEAAEPTPFPAEVQAFHGAGESPEIAAVGPEISRPSTNPFGESSSEDAADQFKTIISVDIDPEKARHPQSFDPFPVAPAVEEKNLDVFSVPFDSTFYSGIIPMPTDDVVPPAVPAELEAVVETKLHDAGPAETADCTFCGNKNELQAVTCQGCLAVLTLADLELVLANQHADKVVLRQAVDKFERERTQRALSEAELTMLGLGHLNLRNLQYGYEFLQEAAQKNPNNVVLSAQVHALLIRLEEIKRQDENHEAMTKGKTILVVDDSPTVRKLIAGKLEKCGHAVHCTNDGIEAMERLADLRPDLILLDINMPRMDGYQVCKFIRSNEATKDVPVVMISGKDGFFDKVRGRMAGTSGYITKPFGPETLMKTVETYLRRED